MTGFFFSSKRKLIIDIFRSIHPLLYFSGLFQISKQTETTYIYIYTCKDKQDSIKLQVFAILHFGVCISQNSATTSFRYKKIPCFLSSAWANETWDLKCKNRRRGLLGVWSKFTWELGYSWSPNQNGSLMSSLVTILHPGGSGF